MTFNLATIVAKLKMEFLRLLPNPLSDGFFVCDFWSLCSSRVIYRGHLETILKFLSCLIFTKSSTPRWHN